MSAASAPARILVVEDERVVARSLQILLESMGYAVPASASTGLDAIRLAGSVRPDLVLRDINLEGAMDG
ncbi:MAG: response regulator, partial [Gemmataceae bacterium]|nr:response regulator [Gemmataceae bacterium]